MYSNSFRFSRRARGGAVIAMAVALVCVASGCAPGGSAPGNTDATNVTAHTLGDAQVSLTLYDGQGLKPLDDALIAAFQKQHPNVTIAATYDPDNVTSQNQPRRLASETPPDLTRVVSVTANSKAGLLTDLTPYQDLYGWNNMPATQLVQFRAANGVAGSGALYAKPSGFTMTGLYYNKQLAQQIGMDTPPRSVAELTGLFASAKKAGLYGLVVGNKEGTGVFPFQLLLNSGMGVAGVSNWVFNAPGATIDTPEATAAAEQIVRWGKAGYFPEGVNGLDATAADAMFAAGKGVFYAWGNWAAVNLDKTMPGKIGFIPMPPAQAGGQLAAMSDAATAFGIPAKSKHKDAAAAFLDFLSSDKARQIAIENGFMPSGLASQAVPTVPKDSVMSDVVKAFTAVSAAGGQVPFVQNATAAIANQAWNPESQRLYGGEIGPEEFVRNVQATYKSEIEK